MIILGIESSAVAASAAVMRDNRLISLCYTDNGLTHSVTLLPMIRESLEFCGLTVSDVDLIAVAAGPGSFTGLRIGASAVKGLAALGTPCLGVSTLEAMAYDHRDFDGIVCACMDARCGQLYNSIFQYVDGSMLRLCPDRAVEINTVINDIKNSNNSVLLVGDGAKVCYNKISEDYPCLAKKVRIAAPSLLLQRASGVCAAAAAYIENGGKGIAGDELAPVYLRLPQAERELIKKENSK